MEDDSKEVVRQLGEKLSRYTQDEAPGGKILRVLKRLEAVEMTLDILQDTKIGKKVHKLRKMEDGVGERARGLVQQWKELLPVDGEEEKVERPAHSSHGHLVAEMASASGRGRELTESKQQSSDRHELCASTFLEDVDKRANKMAARLRVQQRLAQSTSSGHKGTQSSKYARSLAPPTDPASSGRRSPSLLPQKPPPVLDVSSITVDSDTLSSYSAFYNSEGESSRKRAAPSDVNASSMLSKKTRTQVYSGRASSAPATARKLLDLCTEVLQKNIDALEYLGPLPGFILEQLLDKCDVQQMKRLEKFNPQLLEEFDSGWKKLCRKHFKNAFPSKGQTWRELYCENEAHKETHLLQVMKDIRARKKAAEEPLRQTASIAAPRSDPTKRRRGGWGTGGFSSRGHSSSSFGSGNRAMNVKPVQSLLMKKSVKMAKERSQMLKVRRK